MKRLLCCAALAALTNLPVSAAEPRVIPLWPDGAPGALGKADQDIPTLTFYPAPPATATGACAVICPGGAYEKLAGHEGKDYALWLNTRGVTGFVLKYRLGANGYRHPVMLHDAARAVRLVRANAATWKVDPKRVAIMGSSAGGHLAATLLTHFDGGDSNSSDSVERQSSRPDLGILCYPVISMGPISHPGSRKNLLGEDPSDELVKLLSNELQVTAQTPPCFIWHTWEDPSVKVENSLEFALALRKAGVRFDLHIYEKGIHGIGLNGPVDQPAKLHDWTRDCASWLKVEGFGR